MPSFHRSTSTSSTQSAWSRLTRFFTRNSRKSMSSCRSSAIYSIQTDSADTQPTSISGSSRCSLQRPSLHSKRHTSLDTQHTESSTTAGPALAIPPFSPTYCKPNEFPYSNFYVRLPNGKWMVRYRSGSRDILGTDELEGYMI